MNIVLGILIMILGLIVCFPAKKEEPRKFRVKLIQRETEKETVVAQWNNLTPGIIPFDSGLGAYRIEFQEEER